MKLREIKSECAMMAYARVGGKDSDMVISLMRQLLYLHWLVGISVAVIACKVFMVILDLGDLPSRMRGAYLKSVVLTLLIFGAGYVVSRILLAAFWAKHCDRDFDVEVSAR